MEITDDIQKLCDAMDMAAEHNNGSYFALRPRGIGRRLTLAMYRELQYIMQKLKAGETATTITEMVAGVCESYGITVTPHGVGWVIGGEVTHHDQG